MIMNKELPLDERIQKLFESGWVNEFNYLENQLQEARYLLACLNEKYNQLTNNWNELEEDLKNKFSYYNNNTSELDEDTILFCLHRKDVYREILGKMNEIKEGK